MLLPSPRHQVEPAPLSDERRRALAAEGLVLLARQQAARRIEARALDDAADLLPRERRVGAPELTLVPSRKLGIVDDGARRGAARLRDERAVELVNRQEPRRDGEDIPPTREQVLEE